MLRIKQSRNKKLLTGAELKQIAKELYTSHTHSMNPHIYLHSLDPETATMNPGLYTYS